MIYVWVRRTLDWRDEEAFRAQLEPKFAPRVDLWNRTLDPPFHLFRHRVREIARASLAACEGVAVVCWDQIPEGEVVVPVDDDDWLAPSIGHELGRDAAANPEAPGWRWPGTWLEVPTNAGHRLYLARRRLLPFLPERWYCSTNNYALRKGPESLGPATSHMQATNLFMPLRRAGELRVLDRPLSAVNRTLASQTSLRPLADEMTRGQLLRRLRAYRRLYARPVPERIRWAEQYVEAMATLMDGVSVKGDG